MAYPRYTPEEVSRRGRELYETSIRDKVEVDNKGRYLVVDIETGDYEIADDYLTPSEKMLAERPDAALFALRIGYPALGRIAQFRQPTLLRSRRWAGGLTVRKNP